MRMCMKCGHVHKGTPDPQACPACGAVYAKVAAAQQGGLEARRTRPAALAQADAPRQMLARLRAQTAYPTYRAFTRAYSLCMLLAGVLAMGAQWLAASGAAAAVWLFGLLLWGGGWCWRRARRC